MITRIETRERPVGIVLLENILKAQKKGSPVRPHYPSDGSIAVPSPIAIMSDTRNPEIAKKIYDWFFSDEAQRAIVKGNMYSPLVRISAPVGAISWLEISTKMMKWNPELLSELYEKRDEIKKRFTDVVLRK